MLQNFCDQFWWHYMDIRGHRKLLPFLIIHFIIRINLTSTDIPQKCSKFFFSMESFELHFGLILNGKRMNQKAKPKRTILGESEKTPAFFF